MARLVLGLGPAAGGPEGGRLRARFASLVSRALGTDVAIEWTESYRELIRLALEGRLHIAWLPPALYVRVTELLPHARLLVACVRATPGRYHGALFVRARSPHRSIADLDDGMVAWVDPASCSGYLFPRFALLAMGIQPKSFFAAEEVLGSHQAVVQAVAYGTADVGATYVNLEGQGPEIDRPITSAGWSGTRLEMRPLLVSRPIPADVLCATRRMPVAVEERVVAALTEVHERRGAEAVLGSLLQVKRFEPADPRDYEVVRAALNVAHLPVLGHDGLD